MFNNTEKLTGRKIKKIVLVETRSPDFHVYSKYPLPRLGTLILGTLLEQNGYEVKIFVENLSEIKINEVLEADLVGISTITSTNPRGYELAKLIKTEDIPVVMGGPHVTFLPEEALQYVDFVIRGEADDVFLPFVKALEGEYPLEKIPGLSYKLQGKIIHNSEMPFCKSLNSLPTPDFNLISEFKKLSIFPVMTSRGCPYDCNFCSVTRMFGRNYRFKEHEKVIEEIKSTNSDWIFFYDDNFTASPRRTKELLKLMIKNGVTPHWTAQVRTDAAKDEELLEVMKESNCYGVYVGIESINPYTLEYYNKKQTLDQIKMSIDKFHSKDIKIHGMFVLGADNDTVEVIKETVKFAKENKLDTVQFMVLTPLPGTPLYNQLEKENRILTRAWHLYDAHHVVFKPVNMTPFQLQIETVKAMKNFYSLGQIIKSFFKLDFYTFLVRVYARRVIRKWKRKNKYYFEISKNFTYEIGKKLEVMAKTLSYDLWNALSKLYKKVGKSIKKSNQDKNIHFKKSA